MTLIFLRPLALLGLAVLPLLVLFARRARRRHPRPVSTYILLERAAAQTPPQKRRLPWPRDFVRVLPAALAVVALAGPAWHPETPDTSVAVVVDRSFSMGTRSADGSRLARGLARLEDAGLGRLDLVPVPATDRRPLEPGAGTVSPSDLLGRALSLAAAGRRVLIVTDRTFDVPAPLGVLRVTDESGNAGIVGAGIDGVDGLLVRVAGVGVQGEGVLEVLEEGRSEPRHRFTLAAAELPWRGVMPVPGVADGVGHLSVRLTWPGDANPADDVVVLVRRQRAPRIALPPTGHGALYRAFAANPAVVVFRGAGPADLRVGDGDGRRHLWVAPETPAGFTLGAASAARGRLRAPSDPGFVTDALDLPSVREVVVRPPSARDVLRIGERPLIVSGTEGDLLLLQDPEASSWPDQPSFPLVFARLLDWTDLRVTASWSVVRGGGVVRIPARRPRAQVVLANGTTEDLSADDDGFLTVPLDRPGIAEVRWDDGATDILSAAPLDEAGTVGPFAAAEVLDIPGGGGEASALLRPLDGWCMLLAGGLLLFFEVPGLARRARIAGAVSPRPSSGSPA